jgi:hypothetical protein
VSLIEMDKMEVRGEEGEIWVGAADMKAGDSAILGSPAFFG